MADLRKPIETPTVDDLAHLVNPEEDYAGRSHSVYFFKSSIEKCLAGGSALTLMLLSFGIGIVFSSEFTTTDSSASGVWVCIAAGIYLLVVATLASCIGGRIAERLFINGPRPLSWAFATVILTTLLTSSAVGYIAARGGSETSMPVKAALN